MKIKIVTKNNLFASAPFEYAPGYIFTAEPACKDYDWLVVFDDLAEDETVICLKERTVLATWEPVNIKNYCKAFTHQFGHLLTNRPASAQKHPHYHLAKGYFPWFNGRSYEENRKFAIPPKTKLVSAVCSVKAMRWTRHFARIKFLKRFIAEIPGAEWYGHGIRELTNKYEALDSYRYHVAMENHIGESYWSEKIADAFLCGCLPFYAGAPNLADDFPADSFIPIPIDNPDRALQIIREAMAADEWSKRLPAIMKARELLFSKYNFWAQVIKLIEEESAKKTSSPPPPVSSVHYILHSRKYIRKHSLSAKIEDGIYHLKQYLSGVGLWKKMY